MSDNKVKGKLDYRNITVTQFDPGQTAKMAFSELQSAYKYFQTNAILKQPYTHFVQVLDSENRPTRVEYYQATDPAIDRITVRADVAGDLAGTYILLQEFVSKKTIAYYFVVSGTGSAPGVADVEIPVVINNNDPQSLVAFALRAELKNTEEFNVIDSMVLAGYVEIEYLQFGETAAIDVDGTGFAVVRQKEGSSFLVGEVDISYDSDGNPIYNGNLLKGLKYNPFTASFDVAETTSSGQINLDNCITLVDTQSSTLLYVGYAEPGTDKTQALWQIKRVEITDGETSITYADSNDNFDNIWNDRASLSYG